VNDPLHRYLDMLAGRKPGERLIEVRSRTTTGTGMTQTFFAAATQRDHAAAHIRERARSVDVYVGAVLRDHRAGGKAAISGSHLVWVEIDQPDAYRLLLRAQTPPSAVIASGTAGHLHAYWQLEQPVTVAECERANRRLTALLDGDPASTDIARILRPPGTVNHKREPVPVTLEHLDPDRRYQLEQILNGLPPDPKQPTERPASRPRIHALPDGDLTAQLRAIPTAEYVEALTGRTPNPDGKIQCPFHAGGQERTPSLHCFADGCFQCFGCGKGGTIFDFAAALYNQGTKGHEFLRLRDELAHTLGLSNPTVKRPTRAPTPTAIVRRTHEPAGAGTSR